MSHDPLYDDAVLTRLEFQQKPNINIESVKNDLKLNKLPSPKHGKGCLTRVLDTYQPQSLECFRLTVCILNCSVSVYYL